MRRQQQPPYSRRPFLFGLLLASCAPLLTVQQDAFGASLDQPFSSSFARLTHAPCVTLFHRDGRLGCGTLDRELQKGQLLYFDGSLPENVHSNFVAVMEDYKLTAQSLNTLMALQGGPLQGILVLNATNVYGGSSSGENTYHSPDSQTPQGYNTPSVGLQYGYYSYPWNAKGEDLLALDLWGLPMAYVSDSDVSDALRQESQSSSSSSSQESVIVGEFNYYMGQQNINSLECLQWKDLNGEWSPKCLPLGGTSVWATCGSPPKPKSSSSSNNNGNNNNNNGKNKKKSVVMVTGSMDSTSLFHDAAPGANTAASNILTLLMTAKLLGDNLDDDAFDALPKRILIGLFDGEQYGFLGSRTFLRDVAYPGFSCNSQLVPTVSRMGEKSEYACLNPVRQSLAFSNLGYIAGMLSVDQVGHEVGDGLLYVHANQNNDNYGAFLANVLMASGTNDISVASASTAASGDYGFPYPPTPLTSLLSLSQGYVGGAVLTGYDYAFTNKVPYHSHMDSASRVTMNLKSIAASATIMARAALAAAYDDGSYDSDTASAYALNLIPELSYKNELLQELAHCVYYDGQCDLFQKYSQVELANDRIRTGLNLGLGQQQTVPPNYYVGVYNLANSQPFVQVGERIYGAYDGHDYGSHNSDAVGIMPSTLATSIRGLLNHFLGRGQLLNNGYSSSHNDDDAAAANDDGSGSKKYDAISCNKLSDCENAEYCSNYGEYATCSGGGICVCRRAHYHVALDEALKPAVNYATGYFELDEDEGGNSPIYTEPYWSNDVGVRVYRDVGWMPGFFTLVSGLTAAGISVFSAFVLRVGLKKEKLY